MTREEAIELLCAYGVPQDEKRFQEALDMAIEALQADPVSRKDTVTLNSPISIQADMVAVVRCKDCKWNMNDYMGTWCSRLSSVRYTNADDFCSYGERREP